MNNPIYVFDLDGVITNPGNSQVDTVAVEHIYQRLRDGFLVAINTGRSYQWVQTQLIALLDTMGAADTFERLIIVCEKGGECIEWHDGEFTPQPSRFALIPEAHTITHDVFENNKSAFLTMFWDDTKQSMATIEKEPAADLEAFKAEQLVLTGKLADALQGYDVKVDPTTIATDVESPLAGKHAGAELIYEWAGRHMPADQAVFISFGDSKSDYEMARYFAQQGNDSTFVFVGAKTDVFSEAPGVHLLRTDAEYAAGTREYFERNLS